MSRLQSKSFKCSSWLWLWGIVGALTAIQSAPAADILLVGGRFGPDDALVSFLEGKGHAVTNTVDPYIDTIPSATELDAAEIVIVSRNIASGDYDSPGFPAMWNAIEKPMILMSNYLPRTSRWGWFNTTAVSGDVAAPTDFNAFPNPSHPFVDGLATSVFPSLFADGSTAMRINWSGTASQVPAGSTVVATMTIGGDADVAGIVDIPVGTTLFADNDGTVSVTPNRRVYFQMNDYADVDQVFTLSENGGDIFNNIINELSSNPIVPGDVTGNGIVDINDYYVIEAHFQQSVTLRTEGDLNSDGFVDFADFRQWKNNRTDLGSGSTANLVVPEPSSAALIILCSVGIVGSALGRRRLGS